MAKQQTKHYFFLNPYKDSSFSKCPKCGKKTKLRKFPLVIHIEPNQFFVLNKICKYCPECDLIITKKLEIETLMAGRFEKVVPSVVGNKYVVFGTLDKNQWLKYSKTPTDPSEVVNQVYIFKDVLKFELAPRGWYKDDSLKK
ncbi:MAG: hypothetical protein ACYC54_07715 [Sedimentisphaerales bacterium]